MKDDRKIAMTFRMKPQHIQWIRTCAEIEDRKIISVIEEAIEAYFFWHNVPETPKTETIIP